MRRSKKILIAVVSLILAIVIISMGYWLIHYYFYNEYRKYLTDYEVEQGAEFTPLSDSSQNVQGMDLAAENDYLKLYVNTETGEVAVYDKRNGQITYSNPADPDTDSIASETNKNYLKSQLIVDYFNTSRTQGTMDSYSFCTAQGQLATESIKDGIRFIYTIGDMSNETGVVPQYISMETLDSILSVLPEDEAKFVKKKYTDSTVAEGYLQLLDSAVKGASQLRKLNTYFEEAGFTLEDYAREMEGSGVDGVVPITFEIPMEYRLDKDAVDVSIPMKDVVENGGGTIFRIQMLRYFGAAGLDEEGYILVPNGSGSIINFNNGKSMANIYSEYVYGIDPLAAEYTVMENTEDVKMALYGLFRKKNGVFATIEEGASYAYISAGVSGKINDYNYVYPTFVVRGDDKLSMFGTTGNEADIPIVESKFYAEDIKVKYTMLTEENNGYAGAANYYRNRLLDEGILKTNQDCADIKFYYDILGGVQMTKFFLGSQYDGMYAMTTFDQAEEISNDLAAKGITKQVMNYQGWMNGGYYHDVVDKIKVPLALGGKSGLAKLNQTVSNHGGSFYADVALQKVSYISDRYSENNESSRYYGAGYIAEFGLVNPSTLRQTSGLGYEENHYYLVSPKFVTRYVDKFTKKIQKYEVSGISLRDLGNELHSDKKRTNTIDREQSLDVVCAMLSKIDGVGKNVMLNDSNDYAFAYADDIINAPLTDNDYYIVDATVPFYEMLIHGCIDYAGQVINLNDSYDENDVVLNLIENGASPHFVFSYECSNEIKNTGLNRFYATTYENWKEEAEDIYNTVNAVLKNVSGATIINHQILQNNVRAITYSNGITIYVNYSSKDQTVDGKVIPAKGYEIGGR